MEGISKAIADLDETITTYVTWVLKVLNILYMYHFFF